MDSIGTLRIYVSLFSNADGGGRHRPVNVRGDGVRPHAGRRALDGGGGWWRRNGRNTGRGLRFRLADDRGRAQTAGTNARLYRARVDLSVRGGRTGSRRAGYDGGLGHGSLRAERAAGRALADARPRATDRTGRPARCHTGPLEPLRLCADRAGSRCRLDGSCGSARSERLPSLAGRGARGRSLKSALRHGLPTGNTCRTRSRRPSSSTTSRTTIVTIGTGRLLDTTTDFSSLERGVRCHPPEGGLLLLVMRDDIGTPRTATAWSLSLKLLNITA